MMVELCFPVRGTMVPRDHGYFLYSAISSAIPELHEARWLGVHPLSGVVVGPDQLALRSRTSLRLRLPAERIPLALGLAGRTLPIGGGSITLAAPNVQALEPASSLDARLVVIRLTRPDKEQLPGQPERLVLDRIAFEKRFRAELSRQLLAIGIAQPFDLCGRRAIQVAGRRVVGFSVRVRDLAAEQSVA